MNKLSRQDIIHALPYNVQMDTKTVRRTSSCVGVAVWSHNQSGVTAWCSYILIKFGVQGHGRCSDESETSLTLNCLTDTLSSSYMMSSVTLASLRP